MDSGRRCVMTSCSGVSMLMRRDLAARHHQLLRLPQVQSQRTLQAPVLVRLEQSAVTALGDQQLDLFRRVDVTVAVLRRAEQPQQQQAGAVQPLDERPVHPQGRHHRHQGVERRLRRVLERERLRNELREDHLRDRQHEQHDDRGRRLGGDVLQAAEPANSGSARPQSSPARTPPEPGSRG